MDCEDKINMLVSSDEKKKKILESETTYKSYMNEVRKVLNDTSVSSSQKRIKAQEIFNKTQEYLAKRNLNELKNLEKKAHMLASDFDILEKTDKTVKDVLLMPFERSLANPTTIYDSAEYIYGQLDNPVKDTLINSGLLENANGGLHDPHIMDILIKGHDNDVPAQLKNVARPIAGIFKNNGLQVYTIFNEQGAMIKYRDDHGVTNYHDAIEMINAGESTWTADMKKWVDPEKTFKGVKPENIDEEFSKAFSEMTSDALDIDTEGPEAMLKRKWTPDASVANLKTYQSKRVFHFKDGASWAEHNQKYGAKKTLLQIITERNKSTSKAIALMERFGTDARANHESHIQNMISLAGKDLSFAEKNEIIKETKLAYDIFTGRANTQINNKISLAAETVRDLSSLAYLGKAVTASLIYDPYAIALQRAINTGRSPLIHYPMELARNLSNIWEMSGKSGEKSKIEFAKQFGLAIDTIQEDMINKVYNAEGNRRSPTFVRKLLNGMYTGTGASHSNKVARITGARAAIADIIYASDQKDSGKFKQLFTDRTGLSSSELKEIRTVFENPQGKISELKSKATQRKLAMFMSASFESASPGVDARFKRQFFQGKPSGSPTGEFFRAIGQFKGASWTQMYAFGEYIKASKPNPLKTPTLGSLHHAVMPLSYLVATGVGAGIARYMLTKTMDGQTDKIDFSDEETRVDILKNAVQSSGAFGGAFSDTLVMGASWLSGEQTTVATLDQAASWAAPAPMYAWKTVDRIRKTIIKEYEGQDLSRKDIEGLTNSIPLNNAPGVRAVRSWLLDYAGY